MEKMTMRIAFFSIVMIALGLFAAKGSPAGEVSDHRLAFYDEYIDKKIEQIELEGMRITRNSPNSRCSADLHQAQAEFYAVYKDELIGQMAERDDIGESPTKVDFFIANAFFHTSPREKISSCRIGGSAG